MDTSCGAIHTLDMVTKIDSFLFTVRVPPSTAYSLENNHILHWHPLHPSFWEIPSHGGD